MVILQIVNAYNCMHNKLIMHRDIKLENILLHNDKVRLADFGFCK
jgi:serine/threonine protein kinase